MPLKPPFLILEAGLHGDGDLKYYELMVRHIRSWWTGWPRIVFKVQRWEGLETPWALRVQEMHDRPPMNALSREQIVDLGIICHSAGLGFCVTAHDVASISPYLMICDFLKLGSVGFADTLLRQAAVSSGFPLIVSKCLAPLAKAPAGAITLTGESLYPANSPWDGKGDGYTAHNVPELATDLALHAASAGARVIEIHVTDRSYDMRPLPGDMCVSVGVEQFKRIADKLGCIWKACQ